MNRKTIVITMLLIAATLLAGCQVTKELTEVPAATMPVVTQPTPKEKAVADLKVRIGQLEVLEQEKRLTRDIMKLQLEIAELDAKAPLQPPKSPPVQTKPARQKAEVPAEMK